MLHSEFAYHLPAELIAQEPLARRSASRLLVLEGNSGKLEDRAVRDLPALLETGDLLVFNDTRAVAARLIGTKPSGGRVEMLLERPLEGNQASQYVVAHGQPLVRPSNRIAWTPWRTIARSA